jgi:TRAP-type C4-dicarboxylate transport system permease small subunit
LICCHDESPQQFQEELDMKEDNVNPDSSLWLNRGAASLRKVVMPLSRWINYVGMALLVMMMLLTFVDVIGRYVFNRPITGSIELVEFMMVVLVAFVVAYGALHGSLITVDVVTERLRKRARAVLNTLNSLVNLCVFILITWQSIIYAISLQEAHRVTATFAIPIYPFVYLIALGSAILCLVFIYNLLVQMAVVVSGARWQLWSVLFLVVLVVAFLFFAPAWMVALRGMVNPITAGIIGTILMVLILFIEMPIGISMVLVGFVGLAYIIGLTPALTTLSPFVYATAAQYTMSIVPLFVLMGTLCFHSGISKELFDFAYKWFGRLPGGLAIATIGASAIFSAVSGSSVAGVVTIGTVTLPEMRRYKYDDALSTGAIAAGGCLNILIPPSMILVIYGILTETSIGKLLLAGFIPGILQAAMYMIVIFIMCKRNMGRCRAVHRGDGRVVRGRFHPYRGCRHRGLRVFYHIPGKKALLLEQFPGQPDGCCQNNGHGICYPHRGQYCRFLFDGCPASRSAVRIDKHPAA